MTTETEIKNRASLIESGNASLGIEMGSTRIKSVLIAPDATVLASGAHDWENQLIDGLWSYSEEMIWEGVQASYADLAAKVKSEYGVELRKLAGLGFSAMMHGYLAFDAEGNLLVPFRTWRNTNTSEAVEELSPKLNFNLPHRWSSAHLYQAVLNGEKHLTKVGRINTLAGMVHEKLSDRFVLGIGDASGVFPIDSETMDYDAARLATLQNLLTEKGFTKSVHEVFPKVLVAGDDAGTLTARGAALLDPTGTLEPGCPMCPPEGDAGTGMVATNAVAPRTGNVSAGTSIFAMVVLERALAKLHPELDMVTTPDGAPVAMVHSNNGTSEWDQWVGVFRQFAAAAGVDVSKSQAYDLLYDQAFKGSPDGAGLVAYNFLSGEPVLGLEAGRPMFARLPDSKITLPDFMRTQLMSIFGVLRVGMDILTLDEGVAVDQLFAHGGLFKTPVVGQQVMSDALNVPVAVAETASEGGAWGIAILALYRSMVSSGFTESLPEFLATTVFTDGEGSIVHPHEEQVEGFNRFMELYRRGIPVQEVAGCQL
ncbi:FGGY-family carbohydrate kinase [Actinomycetaceae bacterium MB13-C1-2]|nr:FGGY-family carbohydrate kinase [Actinomycetaceae bacterium MB13-C1-2]